MKPISTKATRIAAFLLMFVGLLSIGAAQDVSNQQLAADAQSLRRDLVEKVMPYWCDTTVDKTHGGYLLADDLKGRKTPSEKQIVTQARMIWGFSHAHIKKLGGSRDYLAAARQGYEFMTAHFLDPKNGGYYWSTDLDGKVTNDEKLLYGESFVIYGFVEYSRASGDHKPVQQALELFDVIQKHAHDALHKGWEEYLTVDWQPNSHPKVEVEVPGLRSANAHLHWMEALAELYDVSHEPRVKEALIEALELNKTCFYPLDPAKSSLHRKPDWTEATGPRSSGVSYGHNVEFAWLMVRAERVLGRDPSWPHFFAHVDHAMAHALDNQRGGLFYKGFGNDPATETDKIWWVQAEMLAALTDAIQQSGKPAYKTAAHQLIQFVQKYQADPKDSIWIETVTADGNPKNTSKAHSWKGNYHDVRAIVKFIDANPFTK